MKTHIALCENVNPIENVINITGHKATAHFLTPSNSSKASPELTH